MAQMTRTHTRVCKVDVAAHLEDRTAQNNNFEGVNKRFPAKRAKYWNIQHADASWLLTL